jgi:hypothetical protein
VVAAAASSPLRAVVAVLLASGVWCADLRICAAAGTEIDPDEILDEKPVDTTFRVTSVTTRLSAFDQKGNGYQSRAGEVGKPGSQRLTVFEPQLEIIARQGDRLTHRLWVPVDIISSASADGIDRYRMAPDVMSSASRHNEAGTIDLTTALRAGPSTDLALRNGIHLEEEWRSWHSGFSVSQGFAEQTTVVSAGVLTAFDWFDHLDIVGRRNGRTTRATHTGTLGITQVLSPTTLAEASYGLTVQTGELGNTWNSVPLADGSPGTEIAPDLRVRHAFVVRAAQALPWNGVLKGYYRFYADDWSIRAVTVEGQLLQRLTPLLYVGVGYRHHTQTGASFFTTRAPPTATFRTADSDLDTLGSQSVSGRIALDVPLLPPGPKTLHVDVGVERYWRTNDLQTNVLTCSTGFLF